MLYKTKIECATNNKRETFDNNYQARNFNCEIHFKIGVAKDPQQL